MFITFEYDSDESTPERAVEKLIDSFRAGEVLYFAVSADDSDGEANVIAADIRGVLE